ncbi:hypothetical protein [Prescottella equi]|uniref:hypothetical protein n=1 Tax=Rhodococcus hoagii TaxID=43767 RepID=UPI0015849F06|nr:hypothetical protein [Prescottella equi]
MMDTITPASLRAHADWMVGAGQDRSGQLMRQEAARLEAESARDEETETLAKVYRAAFKAASYGGSGAIGSWTAAGVRAVLDRLAADGRLLPEGGTVLTAEQVAEARELLDAVDLDAEEFHVLRAAFTPPAESVTGSGPDGTPENPWPTWQDVPEGVVYRGTHRDGSRTESRWMNRGGECWVVDGLAATHPESYRLVNSVAPFVRVDGDKA